MQGLWSLIGKMGTGAAPNFPYEIGEKVGNLESKSVWELHQGKKKGTGEPVSVFVVDVKNTSESKIEIAKAGLRRLKSLRHPNVVRFIDGLETESVIYVVTEPVVPLEIHLAEDENSKSDLAISWGIHQIAASLDFLINNAGLIHGNICMASVFVDVAGEWKIGGVEYLQPVDPPSNSEPSPQRLPTLQVYDPPEGRKFSKTSRKLEKWSMDMWGLGCLIWEIYNGILPRTTSLKSVGKIPGNVVTHYVELVSANPKKRPNPAKFIDNCRQSGGFMKNEFVDANLFLQELQIKDPKEQKEFFSSLSGSLDKFPEKFCRYKILPQLLNAFEFGAAGSAVLGPLFKVGKLLDAEEYQQRIVPCVVKLFSSTDRATRINLLQQLDNFVQHLKPATVDEQIFPHVALGFNDTVPAMREHTVKSMLLLVPKLSEKTINNQLLKHFAKLQMDQQPGIRTNTTVCLGKVACHLSEATRQKVLVSAFLRPIRDPFPPARSAGVMAFGATQEYYSPQDCATRILPALCTLTTDPERSVRDQAFKTIKLFLSNLEKISEDPGSAINQKESEETASTQGSSWTGWAVTSITSKLYRGGGTAAGTATATPLEQDSKIQPSEAMVSQRREKTGNESSISRSQDDSEEKDDSDYGDDKWDEDDWDDITQSSNVMGQLRADLLSAKEDCRTLQEKSVEKSAEVADGKGGDDSGSDYGDWDNDDWSSFNATPTKNIVKTNKKVIKPTRSSEQVKLGENKKKLVKDSEEALVEQLLGTSEPHLRPTVGQQDDSWNNTADEDWGKDFDVIPKVKEQLKTKKPTSNAPKKSSSKTNVPNNTKSTLKATFASSPPSTDFDSWGEDWSSTEVNQQPRPTQEHSSTEQTQHIQWDKIASPGSNDGWTGDEWNTDDWLGQSGGAPNISGSVDLAKKKREERKQQRQQALREKRKAGTSSAMKLGAVKKD